MVNKQFELFRLEPKCRVVHKNRESFDVYIGRGVDSKWGNPYSHKDDSIAEFRVASKKEAIEKYGDYLMSNPELMKALPELKGKVLGCWCEDANGNGKCHGDVLAELVNKL